MDLVFKILAGVSILAAILSVTRRNPVHSALWLIVVMLSLAGIYLAMGAEFLAGVQVFVYAGAVMVLFLFVMMLVGAGGEGERYREGALLGLAAAFLFAFPFIAGYAALSDLAGGETGDTGALATLILGEHGLAFELASLLVLVGLVGTIISASPRIGVAPPRSGSDRVGGEEEAP